MKEFSIIDIMDGVELVCVPANRFKTNEIKLSFCLPLSRDTVSAEALAISLMSNASKEYPDISAINKRLAYLYGASLDCSIKVSGNNHILSLSLSSLDDRFSLGGKISSECVDMLLSLAFQPRLDDNGDFFADDITREQRILIEKIESEQNEKRVYALRRAEELMFGDEVFAINRFGTIDGANAVTASDVKNAWQRMVSSAKIQLVVIGDVDENELADKLADAFVGVVRDYSKNAPAEFKPEANEVRTFTDRIDVKQGKLVLGYRVNMASDDDKTSAMRAFCDTFGGGPYSKLFANVREKMSLCYYCSARYDRRRSCIIIQCGCEEENMDKAIDEIQNQLSEIKNGSFEEELTASRMGLSDMIMSVNDDSGALLEWYAGQISDGVIKSPQTSADENNSVLAEDVKACASLISLDTVYKLCSTKEGE